MKKKVRIGALLFICVSINNLPVREPGASIPQTREQVLTVAGGASLAGLLLIYKSSKKKLEAIDQKYEPIFKALNNNNNQGIAALLSTQHISKADIQTSIQQMNKLKNAIPSPSYLTTFMLAPMTIMALLVSTNTKVTASAGITMMILFGSMFNGLHKEITQIISKLSELRQQAA